MAIHTMNSAANRYEIFAREYVIDQNATRAAIAAGYSKNSAESQGSRLLSKAKVRQIIDKLNTKRATKLEITAEKIDEECARLAFSNMLDYMEVVDGKPTGLDLSKLTRDQAASIQEITEDTTGGSGDGERRLVLRTKFKLSDKTKALDMLYKRQGLYAADKLEVAGLEGLAERLLELRKTKHETGT